MCWILGLPCGTNYCAIDTHKFSEGGSTLYISGAEMGLVLLEPGTTNNSVNVIQNGLKIIY